MNLWIVVEVSSVDSMVCLREHIFIPIFQSLEKPEDDSPIRAEEEVMMPVARVPLWLLVSSRWGQGGPVRNA